MSFGLCLVQQFQQSCWDSLLNSREERLREDRAPRRCDFVEVQYGVEATHPDISS